MNSLTLLLTWPARKWTKYKMLKELRRQLRLRHMDEQLIDQCCKDCGEVVDKWLREIV